MQAKPKPYILVIVTCMLMVFQLPPILPSALAQETVFDYLEQAFDNMAVHSGSAHLADYDCFSNGSCIFGVYLEKGDSHGVSAHFEKGVEYLVIGAGDDRILELDLALISSSGVLRLQDGSSDAIPALQFTADASGEMHLKITNVDSLGAGFSVMLILEENASTDFSLDQIREALDNVASTSLNTHLASSRFAKKTFCLFGGRLRQGQSNFLYNTKPGAGNYALVGAGSNNIANVDIFIYRQRGLDSTSGRLIARDADSDNHPLCSFAIESGHYYLITHKNHTSHDRIPGFVFSVLLQNS